MQGSCASPRHTMIIRGPSTVTRESTRATLPAVSVEAYVPRQAHAPSRRNRNTRNKKHNVDLGMRILVHVVNGQLASSPLGCFVRAFVLHKPRTTLAWVSEQSRPTRPIGPRKVAILEFPSLGLKAIFSEIGILSFGLSSGLSFIYRLSLELSLGLSGIF